MSNETIKAGDVVKLRSGGPSMTVSWIENDEAYCEWFLANKLEGAKFNLTSLVKAQPGGALGSFQ
jgi:uncharacterized protein YodC (DUF2158 family)